MGVSLSLRSSKNENEGADEEGVYVYSLIETTSQAHFSFNLDGIE